MQNRRTFVRAVSAGAVTLGVFLTGCSSTSLVSSWKDVGYTAKPLRNVVVYVRAKDQQTSNAMEDALVASLASIVNATPSYRVFPGKNLQKSERLSALDKEAVRKSLLDKGFDGLLMSQLADVKQSSHYVPPMTTSVGYWNSPTMWGYPGMGGYGYYGGPVAVSPGYTYTDTHYLVQASLYVIPEGSRVWAAETKTTDPDNVQEIVKGNTQLFAESLKKSGVVSK